MKPNLSIRPLFNAIALVIVNLIASTINLGCSHPSDDANSSEFELHEVPYIMGVYETTEPDPDGTGRVFGTPTYSINPGVNAWPNPFTGKPAHELFEGEIFHYPRSITISHLQFASTVEIFRGSLVPTSPSGYMGIGRADIPTSIRPLRKLSNGKDSTQFVYWDLKDEFGNFVEPGGYRAYYLGPGYTQAKWVDIIVEVDPATVHY